jgi:hypothetical protein
MRNIRFAPTSPESLHTGNATSIGPPPARPQQAGLLLPADAHAASTRKPSRHKHQPYIPVCMYTKGWSEFLAANPEDRVRFLALPDFPRSSGSGTGSTQPREYNRGAKLKKTKLHGLSSRANYTDRGTAACRRSDCQLVRIEGAT